MPGAAPRRSFLRGWRRKALLVAGAVLLVAGGAAAWQREAIVESTRFSPSYSRVARLPVLERILPRPVLNRRLVTGIAVTGTVARPVLYVTSSDPRIGGDNLSLPYGDTNSGILSRLTLEPGGWKHEQLVRGLPRSRHDHAPNGLALDVEKADLYIAVGSMTNMGAPSLRFRFAPEYALAGTILRIDLDGLGTQPYDLPTLDDPTRAGDPDSGDPFGGNAGLNQARLPDDGPLRVHSIGLRNPYDVLLTRSGRLFVTVNGSDKRYGAPPRVIGASCTNDRREGGTDGLDVLRDVTKAGLYGGHPNPTRAGARPAPEQPESPVRAPDARQCRSRPVSELDGVVTTFRSSTNGLAEYTSSALGGALQDSLLTVSFDAALRRVDPSRRGAGAQSVLYPRVGVLPLDVTAVGDEGRFPGSIWIADWALGRIVTLEPRSDGACEPLSERCFRRTIVRGAQPEKPTSLAWGPDGRLYVSEQEGLVRALSLERDAEGFAVVDTETIASVRDLPNHDEDGRPAARLPLVD